MGFSSKFSTLPHLPTCPLFLHSSDSKRNSQAKELPSTVRKGSSVPCIAMPALANQWPACWQMEVER